MEASFGGYSVYGLITQTNRFHAAVSLAGMSNLISNYGTFDARRRYDTFPDEQNPAIFFAETGTDKDGSAHRGETRNRHIRNSPLFHVERVTTPVMIIQGDLDYVDIRQGEEFFTALYRENKKARFVRYWGKHTRFRARRTFEICGIGFSTGLIPVLPPPNRRINLKIHNRVLPTEKINPPMLYQVGKSVSKKAQFIRRRALEQKTKLDFVHL